MRELSNPKSLTQDVGRNASLINERDLPHMVEMAVPATGFSNGLRRQMEEFHRSRGIRARFGRHRKKLGQELCRWCFADAAHAEAFHEKFGGKKLRGEAISKK